MVKKYFIMSWRRPITIIITNFADMNTNRNFYSLLNIFPVGMVSAVIFSIVLLLTLMPSTEVTSVGIPHIDKVVHFLMFGALSTVIVFDVSRYQGVFSRRSWFVVSLFVSMIGGAIEVAQGFMGLGRGAEWSDFVADTVGSFIVPIFFFSIIKSAVFDFSLGFRDLRISSKLPEAIVGLYMESFPPEERRSLDSIRALIDGHETYHFSIIFSKNRMVGFISWWDLNGGVYVEHFAINPQLRSHGYGRFAMERFCSVHQNKGVVLEVELPGSNDMADRRIGFYKRCGFVVREEIDYVQPPYAPGLQSVPLLLMTAGKIGDVEAIAGEIKHRVYNA